MIARKSLLLSAAASLVSLLAADLASAQTPFFVVGAGGTFPASNSGSSGEYPHANQLNPPALPQNLFGSSVVVPDLTTRITKIVLRGFHHPWSGDVHFVLRSPSGQRFNIACPVNIWNSTLFGTSCDYGVAGVGSDYEFVDPSVAALDFPSSDVVACSGPAGAYHLPGTYHQYFNNGNGAWPNSAPNNLGILNVPLESIVVLPGTWTLECYDWYPAGDDGTFASWELHGVIGSGPSAYCTAGTSTNGCVPSISGSAQPSTTFANPCVLTVANVEGQKSGLIFYGIDNAGFAPTPWAPGSTSFLCVKPPTQRSFAQSSGGTAGACDGQLQLDWNAFQVAFPTGLGTPWTPGEKIFAQGWYRDPAAPKTTNLSDALELTYQF